MSGAVTAEATVWQTTVDDVPVALAAGGGLLAVAGAEGSCTVLDADTAEIVVSHATDGGLLDVAFSPDGAHLALTGTNGCWLWHAAEGRLDRLHTGGWSARARWAGTDRVAVAAGRHVAVHAADGTLLWRTGPAPSTVTDLTWLRQGREVAVSAYNGIYRFARHRPDPVGHLPYPGSHLAIAASANERWICTGNQDRSVHIWRTRDGNELEMPGYPDKVTRLVFDDAGRWLANNGAPDATVWDFTGKGPAGTSPRMLRAHEAVTALAWQPCTGGVLATGGAEGTTAIWRPANGTPGRTMRPARRFDLDGPATALTWVSSGRLVAATRTGSVHVIRASPKSL